MWIVAALVCPACGDDAGNPFANEGTSGGPRGDSGDIGGPATGSTGAPQADSSGGEPPAASSGESTSADVDGSTGADGASTGSEATQGSGPGDETASTGGTAFECPYAEIPDTLPVVLEGKTEGGDDTIEGSCGGGFGLDHTYLFTAPEAGTYVFDTFDSASDTVLYALEGACEGPELSCNDDAYYLGSAARLELSLDAGDTITVVVDTFNLSDSEYLLSARRLEDNCPSADLGDAVPQTALGSLAEAPNDDGGSCGGGMANDEAYLFTAPDAGRYVFATTNTQTDTRLFVRGDVCHGEELGCSNDYTDKTDAAALVVPLAEGQTVTVIVDSNAGELPGAFQLEIDRQSGACPDEDLGSALPTAVVGNTVGADDTVAGSCGGFLSGDRVYGWTAPHDGIFTFSTEGSEYDSLVAVFDGTCGGEELGCSDDYDTFFDPDAVHGEVTVALAEGQTVMVAVDGFFDEGNVALSVTSTDGDCCIPHAYPGCQNPGVEACVCALDSVCCEFSWDIVCQMEAIDDCGASCR